LRDRIADKPFNVTNLRGTDGDFRTYEPVVMCCCGGGGGDRAALGPDNLGVCLQESAFLGERAATPQQLNRCGKSLSA